MASNSLSGLASQQKYYRKQRLAAEKNKSGATYKKLQAKGYEPSGNKSKTSKSSSADSYATPDSEKISLGSIASKLGSAIGYQGNNVQAKYDALRNAKAKQIGNIKPY